MKVTKKNNKSSFFVSHNNSGVVTNVIEFPLYRCTEGNLLWFLLYNDAMELNYMFFKYINYCLAAADIKTRTNQARDLRLFLIFLKATGLCIDQLTTDDILALIDFLGGNYVKFGIFVKNAMGERATASGNTRSTVINQLSSIRKFLKYNKIPCEALAPDNRAVIHDYINETLEGDINHGRNLNYITEADYQKLLEVIDAANDVSAYLMVELIYKFTLQYHEVNKITVDHLHYDGRKHFLEIPYLLSAKVIDLPEAFYERLKSHLAEYGSLYEKSFPARLYAYYSELFPDWDMSGGKNVCSLLRKGCIFRIIFEHFNQGKIIKKEQLAEMLQVQNSTYLKYYIEEARKEFNNGHRSN